MLRTRAARLILLVTALFSSHGIMAQNTPATGQSANDPLVLIMVIIMLILLLVIGLLANVLLGAATWFHQKQKEEKETSNAKMITSTIVIALLTFSLHANAQNAPAAAKATQAAVNSGGISPTALNLMIGVIAVELVVIFVLLLQLRFFIAKQKAIRIAPEADAAPVTPKTSFWAKLNKFRPAEQEGEIDTGHDYDGIRELDNRLPPWWIYGFYVTIIFAGIYLWRYHISETAPLSAEELQIAMREADAQKAAYLKKSANNVDENTVKLLTDAQEIAAGAIVFKKNCAPCHGASGEGTVGPNLTDDYWLHGGHISEVFKSIKYGWPEKGMRSWKEDLSPPQMAQVASYIKSLHGSNPPNAKEKQGELFKETAP